MSNKFRNTGVAVLAFAAVAAFISTRPGPEEGTTPVLASGSGTSDVCHDQTRFKDWGGTVRSYFDSDNTNDVTTLKTSGDPSTITGIYIKSGNFNGWNKDFEIVSDVVELNAEYQELYSVEVKAPDATPLLPMQACEIENPSDDDPTTTTTENPPDDPGTLDVCHDQTSFKDWGGTVRSYFDSDNTNDVTTLKTGGDPSTITGIYIKSGNFNGWNKDFEIVSDVVELNAEYQELYSVEVKAPDASSLLPMQACDTEISSDNDPTTTTTENPPDEEPPTDEPPVEDEPTTTTAPDDGGNNGETVKLLATGDIGKCGSEHVAPVGDYVESRTDATFLALGDIAYPDGSVTDYAECYHPYFKDAKARTLPVVGNHEYKTRNATGYIDYWGEASGLDEEGLYYSTDIGNWHVIVLNAMCGHAGGCETDDPQYQWLEQDLAANTQPCILAAWHNAYYTSEKIDNPAPEKLHNYYRKLDEAGTDLLITAHAHSYERFEHMNADNQVTSSGIRSFVIGTGGSGLRTFRFDHNGSVIRSNDTWGVVEFELGDGSYSWDFIRTSGDPFTDSGSGTC